MGEMHREWTAHRVRIWGKHGFHFGYSDGLTAGCGGIASVLQRCAGCSGTALIDFDDLRRCHRPAMAEMRGILPPDVCCIVVVENGVTTYRFPYRHQERKERGQLSAHFLDADEVLGKILPVLREFLRPGDVLVFRFAPIAPGEGLPAAAFLSGLERLCAALPPGVRYAVDLNNPRYLLPDYFACLRQHRIAHMLRDHGRGWSILDQALLPWVFPAGYALLQCDDGFPFPSRDCAPGILELVRRCLEEKVTLYGHVEGTGGDGGGAEAFFSAFMEMLDPHLANLSPIRQKAA